MKVLYPHRFDLTEAEKRTIQQKLRNQIQIPDHFPEPKMVAGIDLAYFQDQAIAVIVVMDYQTKKVIERVSHQQTVTHEYIPGLLAFRELPILLPAWEKLNFDPDLVFFDGNGIMHPLRMGLATHASFFLDKPTVGIAKNYFYGKYIMPDEKAGSYQYIRDGKEIIGAVVRTHDGVKPVYISVGNRIDLESAIRYSLHLVSKESRIPEITREPDIWTRKLRKEKV